MLDPPDPPPSRLRSAMLGPRRGGRGAQGGGQREDQGGRGGANTKLLTDCPTCHFRLASIICLCCRPGPRLLIKQHVGG